MNFNFMDQVLDYFFMKISAFIVVFSLLCVTTFGQTVKESQVPAIVKTEFSKKFPAASSINWEMENANEYEAEFRMSGIEISASFSAAGNWLLTETEISFGELPQAITNSFLKNHKHTSDRKSVV